MTGNRVSLEQFVQLPNLALGALALQAAVDLHGDARGVVTAVFQRMQTGHQDTGDVPVGGGCDDAAHQPVSFFGLFHPLIVTCFARLMVSLPSGASLVMVEPAPMSAFWP